MKKGVAVLLFAIVFALSFRFFVLSPGNIGHNWDWTFPGFKQLFSNFASPSLTTWNRFNLGYVNDLTIAHLLPNIAVSLLGQALGNGGVLFIIFLFIFLVSYFGYKRLLDYFVEKSNLNFIPSLLFTFSPFLFNDIIGGSWVMWLSYAFVPIFFLTVISYLNFGKPKQLFFSLLWGAVVIVSLQNFMLINLLIVLYLVYGFVVSKKRPVGVSLKRLVVFWGVMGLVNAYWLLPFGSGLFDFARDIAFKNGGENEFDQIIYSTQSVWNILNLGGYLDRNMYFFSLPSISAVLFQVATFLSWGGIFGFLILDRDPMNQKRVYYWLFVFVIVILLVKGGNVPFATLTPWLYRNIFFLKMFRSPQHLMLVPTLMTPVLLAFSLHFWVKHFPKHKTGLMLVFLVMVLSWTNGWWYSGDLGRKVLAQKNKDHLDFYKLSPEVEKFYEISQDSMIDHRTFFLPATYSPLYLENEYQLRSQGLIPEYMFLDKPTFSSESNSFADIVEKSFCGDYNFDFVNYLSLFSVRNIVLRSDIFPWFTASSWCWKPDEIAKKLGKESALKPLMGGRRLFAYQFQDQFFLPRFYTPELVISSPESVERLADIVSESDYKIRSLVYFENQNKKRVAEIYQPNMGGFLPVLEFRRLNSAKYRVVVHQAKDSFPLVFNEEYHRGWKLFVALKSSSPHDFRSTDSVVGSADLLLTGEWPSQATKEELGKYAASGLISTSLAGGSVEYISKIYNGTIQNNNLRQGVFWETWPLLTVSDGDEHFIANGYANGWIINPFKICSVRSGVCIRNSDGSYDFEFVVEFWPQRLLYLGLGVSVLSYIVVFYLCSRKAKK